MRGYLGCPFRAPQGRHNTARGATGNCIGAVSPYPSETKSSAFRRKSWLRLGLRLLLKPTPFRTPEVLDGQRLVAQMQFPGQPRDRRRPPSRGALKGRHHALLDPSTLRAALSGLPGRNSGDESSGMRSPRPASLGTSQVGPKIRTSEDHAAIEGASAGSGRVRGPFRNRPSQV